LIAKVIRVTEGEFVPTYKVAESNGQANQNEEAA
jgi:hypothetical protein